MMSKQKKAVSAVVAAVLTVAVVLTGTFAWQSISQRARNEADGFANPGGRLHDDFNGENKDVYVENFTDPVDGSPIFARVRLCEYHGDRSQRGGRLANRPHGAGDWED